MRIIRIQNLVSWKERTHVCTSGCISFKCVAVILLRFSIYGPKYICKIAWEKSVRSEKHSNWKTAQLNLQLISAIFRWKALAFYISRAFVITDSSSRLYTSDDFYAYQGNVIDFTLVYGLWNKDEKHICLCNVKK